MSKAIKLLIGAGLIIAVFYGWRYSYSIKLDLLGSKEVKALAFELQQNNIQGAVVQIFEESSGGASVWEVSKNGDMRMLFRMPKDAFTLCELGGCHSTLKNAEKRDFASTKEDFSKRFPDKPRPKRGFG